MSKHLYRGKKIGNGEWIEGDLWQRFAKGVYISDTSWSACRVHSETVGEFTGLFDERGTKVFEDDIIRGIVPHEEISHITARIVWRETAAAFEAENQCPIYGCATRPLCDLDEVEVIGNIHDNPELLGGAHG